jgi:hypothetical protein
MLPPVEHSVQHAHIPKQRVHFYYCWSWNCSNREKSHGGLQEIKGGELQEISSGELTCCLGFGNFIGYGVGHTKFEVSGLGRHRFGVWEF